RALEADLARRLARGEIPDEDALLHHVPALGGDALVVVAERPEAEGSRRIGGDVDGARAVLEGAQLLEREERPAREVRLAAEDAVELGRMPAALVDLEADLRAVEEHVQDARGARLRREERGRLRGDARRVPDEIDLVDELVAARLEL